MNSPLNNHETLAHDDVELMDHFVGDLIRGDQKQEILKRLPHEPLLRKELSRQKAAMGLSAETNALVEKLLGADWESRLES